MSRQHLDVYIVKLFYITIIAYAIPGIVVAIALLFMALFIMESITWGLRKWKSSLRD